MSDAKLLVRAGENMKKAGMAIGKGDRESFAMHATDAIINVLQLADRYNVELMPLVFQRLKHIDRLEAERG